MSFFLQEILIGKTFYSDFPPAESTYLDEDQSYRNYHSDFIQYLIDTYNDVPVDYYPHGLQEVGNSPIFWVSKKLLCNYCVPKEDNVEDVMYSETPRYSHVQQYKLRKH